jgi:LmbE family N-acetylglucosaminyl deacetylase
MARTRAEEAREVARFLGVPEPLLFGLNEHEFIAPQHREALVEAVRGALEEHAPDTVYLPFFHDQHPDHRYLSVLLAGALDRTSLRPRILQYEIMCFVPPGLVLDISDALARKQDLIRRYRSQVEILDYPTFSGAVAVAHASLVGPHCHAAEAYCPLTAEEFLQRTAGLLLDAPGELSGQVLLTPPEGAAP